MYVWFFCFWSLNLLVHPFGRLGKPMVSFMRCIYPSLDWNSLDVGNEWFVGFYFPWWNGHGHDDILHEFECFRKFHHEFQFPSILREISHRGRQILPWLKLSNYRRFEYYANWYAPICHGRKKVKPSLRKNIQLFGDLLMTVGYHHSSGNLLYLLVLSWGFWLEWECSSFRSNQDFLCGITKKVHIHTNFKLFLVIFHLHWQFQKLHHCVSSSGIESMSSGHVGCSASRTEGRMGKKSWSVITRLRLLRLVLQACTSCTSIASTLDFVEMKRQNHYHQHDHFKLLECTYALHPACYEFTTWTASLLLWKSFKLWIQRCFPSKSYAFLPWMSSEVIKTWVWSAAQRPADRQHGLQGGWRLLSHCWVAPSIGCMLPDITSMNPATATQQPYMPIPDTAHTPENWLTYICQHLLSSTM